MAPTRKPPERVTKDRAVQAERSQAYAALREYQLPDSFGEALEKFVRHISAAISLEHMDARVIEGDDEMEIRGY